MFMDHHSKTFFHTLIWHVFLRQMPLVMKDLNLQPSVPSPMLLLSHYKGQSPQFKHSLHKNYGYPRATFQTAANHTEKKETRTCCDTSLYF